MPLLSPIRAPVQYALPLAVSVCRIAMIFVQGNLQENERKMINCDEEHGFLSLQNQIWESQTYHDTSVPYGCTGCFNGEVQG